MPASKAAKHKEGNTHRFLTFSERLARVSVNAVHRIKHVENTEEENDSQFNACLLKWRDQDRSVDFREFYAEILEQSRNFKMVVHYKDHILASLLKYLDKVDSLALQALCELLVALCVDLRSDFYTHFKDFFGVLAKLLNSKDTDRLEWLFNTMSLMFKHLWRYMVSDMESILEMYQGLIYGKHPDHIKSFAAESITFLIRKACGQEDFFSVFFRIYQSSSKEGNVGEILYYLLKGMNGTLYSHAGAILPKLLHCLSNPDLDQCNVFTSLDCMFGLLAKHLQKAHSAQIWDSLMSFLQDTIKAGNNLEQAAKLTARWCCQFCGLLILDETKLLNCVETISSKYSGPHSETISDLCAILVAAKIDYFSQTSKEKVVVALIRNKSHPVELIVKFWRKILKYVDGYNTIRRSMLNYCQVQINEHRQIILELLVDFVLQNSSPPDDAEDVLSHHPFNIDYALISREMATKKIQDSLNGIIVGTNASPGIIWGALLLASHITPVALKTFEILQDAYKCIDDRVASAYWSKKNGYAVVRMVLQSAYFIHKQTAAKTKASFTKLCLDITVYVLDKSTDELHVDANLLFITDMLCLMDKNALVKFQAADKLSRTLVRNLSSPDATIRKFSLRVLASLYPDEDLFKSCMSVERTPATVQTFRDKAMHLSKINYSTDMSSMMQEAALRYLLSNYYVNFSSYWNCVHEKVFAFLPHDSKSPLWSLLFDLLKTASSNVVKMTTESSDTENGDLDCDIEGLFLKHGVDFTVTTEANVKPDIVNFRYLLWAMLQNLPHLDILEKNNRFPVSLFLEFMDNEYYEVDKANSNAQSLVRNPERSFNKKRFSKKLCSKMLIAILKVFARFNNPKGCFMAEKLKKMYHDMLMYSNANVQTLALKCLLKFKDKHLLEFAEQLQSLLDDDRIRDTIVKFNLDEIARDKKKSLVPVLFRLMYGKIIARSNYSSQILRFLSTLESDLMEGFVHLVIEPVMRLVDETTIAASIDSKLDLNLDLQSVVPLSKQNGVLNTLTELIEKHPNMLSDKIVGYLFKLLLTMHLSFHRMIDMMVSTEQEIMSDGTVSFLRVLAKLAHNAFNSLISVWRRDSTLSLAQINSLFYVLVEPHAHKMQNECISQPTALLKLCDILSRRPRFIPLLGNKINGDSCLLNEMTKTLVSAKTSSAVCDFILQILTRLLQVDLDDDAHDESELILQTLSSIDCAIVKSESLDTSQIGILLMVNQVGDILRYFIRKLKGKSSSGLIQTHLQILISLGHYVRDDGLSKELVELLLSHVSNMARAGREISAIAENKSILPALQALDALPFKHDFISPITKLYSRIRSRECRLCLGSVFAKAFGMVVGEDDTVLRKVMTIVSDLNTWDKRFIEELDYDSRLAGFQELAEILESEDAAVLLDDKGRGLLPLVHNCIFTLANHSNDLSLREMSSRAIELILELIFKADAVKYPDLRENVVTSAILPALRRGLNCKDENQRHEWLRLLVKIAKMMPSDSAFSCLLVLSNDRDLDSDFFTNVQHIQMHRRTRAFRKLAETILRREEGRDKKSEIPHTLAYTYLLPLAAQTLKWQDLSKHLHLRDSCLEVVSSCASVMPWGAYVKFLRHNITVMLRQPYGVKLVCSILNSFHFDISSVTAERAALLEGGYLLKKAKKMRQGVDSNLAENVEVDMEAENGGEKICDEISAIYAAVVCDILPRLCRSLSTKLDADTSHKLADSENYSDIDKCAARAPLAIAVVMLLKKLPTRVMNKHLPTVILKMVAFLRHRFSEVRAAAAKVTVEIAEVLEPMYLPIVLRELKDGLMKGYQKHVMLNTVNSVLSKIEPTLAVGELEPSRKILLNILKDDLFGKGEEERGIDQIKSKTPEARGRSRSYNIYRVYAKFSRKESIVDAIAPLKAVLDTTHDHAKRKIVESVLAEINQGLQENSALAADDIMIFLHGLLTDNMPGLHNKDAAKGKINSKGRRPESCLLLNTEPERYGVKDTKKAQKTNFHLIVEFALQFLNSALKRQVIDTNDEMHLGMLDPFVAILQRGLASAHFKIVAESTRCLTKLLKVKLPSISQNAVDIIGALFKILRENAQGTAHNDIAVATYKALSVVCKSEIGGKLSETQLQVLLGYAEEILYDRERQSHAFNVIQSIIGRGLTCGEMNDVVDKIRSISVQSHDSSAVAHARQVYLYYLTHYPITKPELLKHLQFVLGQLTFEFESGRLSSLEMLASLIDSLPKTMVKRNCGVIFVPLSAMLLNEESVKCKKLCAHVLKMLLNHLETEDTDRLFGLVLQWYADEKHLLHQQLGAILVTVFTDAEGTNFIRFLAKLLPLMLKALKNAVESTDAISDTVSNSDHYIFHQISAFHSVLKCCDLVRDSAWEGVVSDMLLCVEAYILHPHVWVRIVSCQVFGTVFSALDSNDKNTLLNAEDCYFANFAQKLKYLGDRFCLQIKSEVLDPKLAEQCVKNLIFVARTLHDSAGIGDCPDDIDDDQSTPAKQVRSPVYSILFKLLKACKQEAADNIKETCRRAAVLKVFAALSVSVDVQRYMPVIMELIYRETERKIVDDEDATALKTLAAEVMEVVKGRIGSVAFSLSYGEARKKVLAGRRERKRQRDVAVVTNPERAALLKRRKQQLKKERRKRKIDHVRPDYGYKRSKMAKGAGGE